MRAWTLAAVLVAALVACHDSGGGGPTQPQLKGDASERGTDSTGRPLPASVDASGDVAVVESFWPPAANGDTLRRVPVAGAHVALARNVVLENGHVVHQAAGQTTTDAAGRWKFDDIPGGYYTLVVDPPAGSGLERTTAYLSATSETVVLMVNLWRP